MDNQSLQADRPQPLHSSQNLSFSHVFYESISSHERSIYYKTMDLSTKLEKNRATLYFLQTCFENSLVPKTFRVNQLPDPRFSETNRKRWFNNIRTLEKNNMRLSIDEQKKLEKVIMSRLQTSLNVLENQVSSFEEANVLKSKLLERQLMVRDREAFNHRRKFFQLVKEEKRSGNFKGKLRFVVCPSPPTTISICARYSASS